jgi:hypothetical protein
LAIGALLGATLLSTPVARAQVMPGNPAPDFSLLDVGGQEYGLSQYAGKVVLLAFVGYGWNQCRAAGPAVEQIWQDFAGAHPFQLLAVDFWNGTIASVQGYIDATGASYPVLRNGGFLSSPSQYGIAYDNYVVVDATGIVRYTSVDEVFTSLGRFHDASIREAIEAALPTTALEGATWSAVKQLYRLQGGPGEAVGAPWGAESALTGASGASRVLPTSGCGAVR